MLLLMLLLSTSFVTLFAVQELGAAPRLLCFWRTRAIPRARSPRAHPASRCGCLSGQHGYSALRKGGTGARSLAQRTMCNGATACIECVRGNGLPACAEHEEPEEPLPAEDEARLKVVCCRPYARSLPASWWSGD